MTNGARMRALFAVLMLSLSACDPATVLEAKDYSAACQHDADCLTVYLGDVCKPCICDNAAISASQSYIYSADKTGAVRSCTSVKQEECAACATVTATCDNGTCKAK